MVNIQDSLRELQMRMGAEPALRDDLETALVNGGVAAGVEVARRYGIDIPYDCSLNSEELSDLELELVTAGKALGAAIGSGMANAPMGAWIGGSL